MHSTPRLTKSNPFYCGRILRRLFEKSFKHQALVRYTWDASVIQVSKALEGFVDRMQGYSLSLFQAAANGVSGLPMPKGMS